MAGGEWPVAVFAVGDAAVGTTLWRAQGQLHVTVVVKATLSMRDGKRMSLVAPRPLARADLHFDSAPSRSVQIPSDLAPYLARTDVVLYGSAYPADGAPAKLSTVRLAVHRGDKALLDKSLYIYGPREKWEHEPKAFNRMPIDYEHAYGAPGEGSNPVGVGAGGEGVPNIIDTKRPNRPAGLGAIAASWPVRHVLATHVATSASGIAEIGEGLDWSYFQAAPRDQRVAYLTGDEWVSFAGAHPNHDRVQSQLPSIVAEAYVWARSSTPEDEGFPIELNADMLVINADALLCTVTWRGSFPVTSEDVVDALRVGAGVRFGELELDFAAALRAIGSEGEQHVHLDEGVLELDDSEVITAESDKPKLPWQQPIDDFDDLEELPTRQEEPEDDDTSTETRAVDLKSAGAGMPWESPGTLQKAPPPPANLPPDPGGFTGSINVNELRAAHGGALPWEEEVPPQAPWMQADASDAGEEIFEEDDDSSTSTITADREAPAVEKSPFPLAEAQPPDLLRPAMIPGAPWTQTPARRVVAPGLGEATRTVDIEALQKELDDKIADSEEKKPERVSETVPQINPTEMAMVASGWHVKPPHALLSVVVKAICDLVPDGDARIRSDPEFPTSDVFVDDDDTASLRYASDYAIYKARADITAVGQVHAAGGATEFATGFRFGSGEDRLERRALVFADRVWGSKAAAPFTTIPLTWERAFGGPSNEDNPVGRGEEELMPNLEDPDALLLDKSERPKPMCFAPIAPTWKKRAAKLGTFDDVWSETRFPYMPNDMDLSFFQAAPPEQQIAYPRGDERFELWGMHPAHAKLSGKLPGMKPRCFVQMTEDSGAGFSEIALNLDTVAFDTDDSCVHLVWRGVLEVKDTPAWEIARLFLQTEPVDGDPMTLEEARQRYIAAELGVHAYTESALGPVGDKSAPPGPDLAGADLSLSPIAPLAIDVPEPPPLPPPLPEDERVSREEINAQLAQGRPLSELNLIDADMSGLDLSDADLSGAIMLRANLKGAILERANLEGAQLGLADLSDASLDHATLSLCDLHKARVDRATFTHAQLDNTNFTAITGDDVSFASSTGALTTFTDANLPRARFDDVQLETPDFSGATLESASFTGAHMTQARLFDTKAEKATLSGATMPDASAVGARFNGAIMHGVSAPGSIWERAFLDECDLSTAELPGASFVKASCEKAIFSGADLRGARFRKAKLVKAVMFRADMMEASFEDTDLSGANLSNANLYGTVGFGSKLTMTVLDGAITERSMVFSKK